MWRKLVGRCFELFKGVVVRGADYLLLGLNISAPKVAGCSCQGGAALLSLPRSEAYRGHREPAGAHQATDWSEDDTSHQSENNKVV